MTQTFYRTVLAASFFVISGCAVNQTAKLVYQPGGVVETLSASTSLSISKGEQGMGSSGYLLYQRPDNMRLVVLSPFGTTIMEAIMTADLITIVNTSKGMAFSGRLEDLPRIGEGETWRHVHWVMETDPPGSLNGNGSIQRINRFGTKEQVTFENGLVVSKSLENGDMVHYSDYELVNGIPLATEIILDSHDGGRFRIKVTEPEVNAQLSPEAFLPRLEGLKMFPLSSLLEQ
jgi:outer membrane lipoprotein-sorting protein